MLTNLFRKTPKSVFPEAKYVIEEAFIIAGQTFYRFADTVNQPYDRALKAIVFHREIEMNCDFDFLRKHTEAVDKVLTSNTISVYQIKALNDLMKQRLTLPKDEELLFKLASIVYFDKNENPAVYDFAYNKKKIEFWKREAGTKDFFLQMPLLELMPFLKEHEDHLSTYFQMIGEFKATHLDVVSGILSQKQKTS